MNPRQQVEMRAGAAGGVHRQPCGQSVARGCTASGSNLYSPECVEEEFCELRQDGVLRSSASERGTLQGKEGDVVLLLPALPHEGV
jgi:hypothetical protein